MASVNLMTRLTTFFRFAFRGQLPELRRRAKAPAVLERLFLGVPEGVFVHALRFWRTDRDV